jgi:hypothetical protein
MFRSDSQNQHPTATTNELPVSLFSDQACFAMWSYYKPILINCLELSLYGVDAFYSIFELAYLKRSNYPMWNIQLFQ